MQRKYRPTIWSKWTKTREGLPKVASIQDNLSIGKIQFSATEKGKDSVKAYVGLKKALGVMNAITSGNFSKIWPSSFSSGGLTTVGSWSVYGGVPSSKAYGGKPECRIVTIDQVKDTDQRGNARVRFSITIKVGEGVVGDMGQIMPKDSKNMIFQRQFLTLEEAYEMASLVALHISAYYARYMEDLYDENGDFRKKGSVEDCFASEYRQGNDEVVVEHSGTSDIPLED